MSLKYVTCDKVSFDDVYKCFSQGFEDYLVPMNISKNELKDRMFNLEGNQLENSYICYDKSQPVGLIFAGVRDYYGKKTMRCGTLCVIPSYRSKGIAKELVKLHKARGKELGCEILLLEVISGNDSGINLYKKAGYQKIGELFYYKSDNFPPLPNDQSIKPLNAPEYKASFDSFYKGEDFPWQSSIQTMAQNSKIMYYTYKNRAFIAIDDNQKIYQLWHVNKSDSLLELTILVDYLVKKRQNRKLSISFRNSLNLTYWAEKTGFVKQDLSQLEMIYVL